MILTARGQMPAVEGEMLIYSTAPHFLLFQLSSLGLVENFLSKLFFRGKLGSQFFVEKANT